MRPWSEEEENESNNENYERKTLSASPAGEKLLYIRRKNIRLEKNVSINFILDFFHNCLSLIFHFSSVLVYTQPVSIRLIYVLIAKSSTPNNIQRRSCFQLPRYQVMVAFIMTPFSIFSSPCRHFNQVVKLELQSTLS